MRGREGRRESEKKEGEREKEGGGREREEGWMGGRKREEGGVRENLKSKAINMKTALRTSTHYIQMIITSIRTLTVVCQNISL